MVISQCCISKVFQLMTITSLLRNKHIKIFIRSVMHTKLPNSIPSFLFLRLPIVSEKKLWFSGSFLVGDLGKYDIPLITNTDITSNFFYTRRIQIRLNIQQTLL